MTILKHQTFGTEKGEMARQLTDVAKHYPGKLETFDNGLPDHASFAEQAVDWAWEIFKSADKVAKDKRS